MNARSLIKLPRKARACVHCAHFAQTGAAAVHRPVGGIYRQIGEQARGDCRAKPPTRDRKSGDAVWPDVVASDWCAVFTRSVLRSAKAAA